MRYSISEKTMDTIKQTIEIDLPVSTVYNQWTQFEEFPKFMEAVREVRQVNDKRLHWKASIGGKDLEWNADIYEQRPDEIIAWRSIEGDKNVGSVSFTPLGGQRTLVTLKLTYEPKDVVEKIADAFNLLSKQLEGDLKRFKQFIEERHQETGAWRGEIHSTSSVKEHNEHLI
jgi:uncharacterized membrane protein